MEIQKIEDVEINNCAKCSGIWFDQDELRKAKDQTDSDLNWMDFVIWKHEDNYIFSQKPIQCPKCEFYMVIIDYDQTNVKIVYCQKHQGVWLDEGEFKSILESKNSDLANKNIPDYISDSLEEGVEIVSGPERFMSEWKDFMTVLRLFQYRFFILNPKLQDNVLNIQQSFPIK